MRERQMLIDALGTYDDGIARDLQDNIELIELGEAEGDTEIVTEAEAALKALAARAAEKELEALLDGEADGNDTYLEINAGAGGTESCDWASMLARMYVRWAEKHGYKVELMAESAGEEAGIRSATYKISGPNAYGWLKSESGVHRLVRISPYDSAARRHTSFSSVWVYPVVDDNIEIDRARQRDPHRHLPLLGRRRPARQHHRLGGADHPPAHRHRGDQLGEVAAPEPRHRHGGAEIAALRAGVAQAHRGDRGPARGQGRCRLGQPDPQLRPAALPDGQGSAHRATRPRTPGRARRRPGRFMAATLAMNVAGKSRAEAQGAD
jgi:peptide chain release factor 2